MDQESIWPVWQSLNASKRRRLFSSRLKTQVIVPEPYGLRLVRDAEWPPPLPATGGLDWVFWLSAGGQNQSGMGE